MCSNIQLINNEDDSISIIGLHWNEYRQIMLAIETTRMVLQNEILDSIKYNEDRKVLAQNIEFLYLNLQEDNIPHKGIAESLDESIIKKCLGIE